MTTRTGARASPVVRACPCAMDKFMDVLGDLPSDSSLTSSDEEDEGGRKNLASSKPKEVTYEDLVKRSYGSAVAAIDEDARRRRDDAKKASAAAKDDDDGKGKKRHDAGHRVRFRRRRPRAHPKQLWQLGVTRQQAGEARGRVLGGRGGEAGGARAHMGRATIRRAQNGARTQDASRGKVRLVATRQEERHGLKEDA